MHFRFASRHTDNNFWLSYRELADRLIALRQMDGLLRTLNSCRSTNIRLTAVGSLPADRPLRADAALVRGTTSAISSMRPMRRALTSFSTAWAISVDEFAFAEFDGTHLYEHSVRARAITGTRNTLICNYGRREVSNYLVGNALYWMERFGIDALRVDAVASMIYRDYTAAKEGRVDTERVRRS